MSVLESLYVGVFGFAVVFAVLIGLYLIVQAQSALIAIFLKKKPEKKPVAAETPTAEPKREPQENSSADAAVYEFIVSPGKGIVLDVASVVGAKVKRGDLLILLDAMGMEYEIGATKSGTVTRVLTTKGESVGIGKPLVEIKLEEVQ